MHMFKRLPLLIGSLAIAAVATLAAMQPSNRPRVLFDSDANNEMDDQYAIAYLLLNGDAFDVDAITVNRTRGGGGIEEHAREAERIVTLAGLGGRLPVFRGASGSFDEIKDQVTQPRFDGSDAVDEIIRRAHAQDSRRLLLLPVGKLTNIALALKKDPSIAPKVRIVWLGSNYPEPGEYNQENDEPSVQYVMDSAAEFEIALVRYGTPYGTAAVLANLDEVKKRLPGKGPRATEPVIGRHGGSFRTFGDYAVNLFSNMPGSPRERALFDMAAVAIVKNPKWATARKIPAPALVKGKWVERPANTRQVVIWENFNREAIMADFYRTMEAPVPVRVAAPPKR
jgi:inosine-uridine nucleoside N-ribohydrolase